LPMVAHTLPEELAAGQRIGPFVLLTSLGSGGSGRVWAAARVGQLGFTKLMALKVLRQDKLASQRAWERFDREARLGARLIHPNVRAVHDLGMHEGRPYMAMRWVDTSLEELLKTIPGNKLEPDIACWLGLQCCAALGAAHGFTDHGGQVAPIIHRDVSPGNILLTADGHVLLSDLAAANDPTDPAGLAEGAKARRFFGNLRYAAPEALREQPLDGRADIFSLGCVLYEALSGSPAFDADDEPSLMFRVLEQGAVDLSQRAPELPAPLVEVVHRALSRERSERFESAAGMAEALSSCIAQPTAFELQERTTRSIREVLGGKLRGREEAMYSAFYQFSMSSLERTDTLPLHQSASRWQSELVSNPAEVGSSSHGPTSRSDGGVTASANARLPLLSARGRTASIVAALGLGLLLIGAYQQFWRQAAPPLSALAMAPSTVTGALEPAPAQLPPARPEHDAGAPRRHGRASSRHVVEPREKPAAAPPTQAPGSQRRAPPAKAAAPRGAQPALVPRAEAPTSATPAAERQPEYPSLLPRIKTNPYKNQGASGSSGVAR
jgi:eukaryotic-like serine/threonine-protein kinase